MRASVAVAVIGVVLAGLGPTAAHADVTAVKGSAFGYHSAVTIFGMPDVDGPAPTVTLAANAANSPQSATAPTGNASAGPAVIFSWGSIAIGTQGALGPGGSATSTATIQNVNASGQENFTATTLASICTATEAGLGGTTTITNGTLQIDNGDSDPTNSIPEHAPVVVNLPANPAPNATYEGHLHLGNTTESFRWVFSEQVVNPDGSLTVNAAHQYLLGPTAVGDLRAGQVVCGVTGAPDTTPPDTTIQSGPSGTVGDGTAAFTFASSEAGSTFECRLDGPGAATGSFAPCSSPQAYAALADGAYTFAVRAKDTAGNADASPATRAFAVTRPAPPPPPPPPPAPPPPPPPVDVTPPAVSLSARAVQRLGAGVSLRVSCTSEPCRATAAGSVRVPRIGTAPAKLHRLGRASASIAQGRTVTLRPTLSRAARTAIRRALRRGRRIVVTLNVTAVDAAGNRRTLTRRVRLRL